MFSPCILSVTLFFTLAGTYTGHTIAELAELKAQRSPIMAAKFLAMTPRQLAEVEL